MFVSTWNIIFIMRRQSPTVRYQYLIIGGEFVRPGAWLRADGQAERAAGRAAQATIAQSVLWLFVLYTRKGWLEKRQGCQYFEIIPFWKEDEIVGIYLNYYVDAKWCSQFTWAAKSMSVGSLMVRPESSRRYSSSEPLLISSVMM